MFCLPESVYFCDFWVVATGAFFFSFLFFFLFFPIQKKPGVRAPVTAFPLNFRRPAEAKQATSVFHSPIGPAPPPLPLPPSRFGSWLVGAIPKLRRRTESMPGKAGWIKNPGFPSSTASFSGDISSGVSCANQRAGWVA